MGNLEPLDHILGGVSFLFIVITNFGFTGHKRWAWLGAFTANSLWAIQSYRIGNWTYFVGITFVLLPLTVLGWVKYKPPGGTS